MGMHYDIYTHEVAHGISGDVPLLRWIENWLSGRKQMVVLVVRCLSGVIF